MINPAISVVIPSRNGNEAIERAIMSVLGQTLRPMEIIVVNDNDAGSTASEELTKIITHINEKQAQSDSVTNPYADKEPAVTLVDGLLQGPGIARNIGVENATGVLIAFLDDDDFWHDVNKLEKQAKYMKDNSAIKLTGVEKTLFVTENGNLIREVFQPTTPIDTKNQMLLRNPIITSSVLVDKETFKSNGGFPKEFLAEDYELWLKIGKNTTDFPISNTPDTEMSYTVRDTSASNKNKFAMSVRVLILVYRNFVAYPKASLALVKAVLRVFKSSIQL